MSLILTLAKPLVHVTVHSPQLHVTGFSCNTRRLTFAADPLVMKEKSFKAKQNMW